MKDKIVNRVFFLQISCLVVILLCSCLTDIYAQKAENISKKLINQNTQIEITYSIANVKSDRTYNCSLWLSVDNGNTYIGPLREVSGDEGEVVSTQGEKLRMVWTIDNELLDQTDKMKFQVRVKVQKSGLSQISFVMNQYSPIAPYGAFVGVRRFNGAYLKLQSNFTFSSADYNASAEGILDFKGDGYWVIGDQSKISSLITTCGLIRELETGIFIYAGLGYGQVKKFWSYKSFMPDDTPDKNGFALVKENSHVGLASECGMIYVVAKKFPVSAGIQNINLGFWTYSAGIGYLF